MQHGTGGCRWIVGHDRTTRTGDALHKIGYLSQSPRRLRQGVPLLVRGPAGFHDHWTLPDGCGGKIPIEAPPLDDGDLILGLFNRTQLIPLRDVLSLRANFTPAGTMASILPFDCHPARLVNWIDSPSGACEAS